MNILMYGGTGTGSPDEIHRFYPSIPEQVFSKLEKALPEEAPLYRSTFESFQDSCYGVVPEKYDEPDW